MYVGTTVFDELEDSGNDFPFASCVSNSLGFKQIIKRRAVHLALSRAGVGYLPISKGEERSDEGSRVPRLILGGC